MKRIICIAGLFITLSLNTLAQNASGIRGVVIDNASGEVLPFASVSVLNSSPAKGALSDSLGHFYIGNLSVGRYDIQASFMGYGPKIFREIMVSSAKDAFLEISLSENATELDEVVVRVRTNKEAALNKMATAGARMFSVEEANRYAGGFDDPARLATSFAGVAGGMSSNSIAIRGNSPQFLQWKLEGIEIPNPSHYADMTGIGGGMLTAFSSQVLGNSDFFTGAFPAEYGNALSGVFDMWLRNGNTSNYEHTAQIGTLGVELASEGPFKKGGQSSYLFNYRYSSMGLANDIAPGLFDEELAMNYQDWSFKLNFPTRHAGTFSLWSIGTIDSYGYKALSDTAQWKVAHDQESNFTEQIMASTGLEHKYFFNPNTYLKTSIAATYTNSHIWGIWNNRDFTEQKDLCDLQGSNTDIVFNTYLNKKFSARATPTAPVSR
ncbi:hypothetical protein AGMMS49982_05820 [Bacteroidia bacterium]|nr:hypothetical protein AGMMS49982_05820 [Bacteroidia bacterium]